MFQSILHTLNSIPADVWSVVVQSAVSALVVSPVFVWVKKRFFDDEVERERLMLFLVMAGSFVAAAVAYLITVPTFAPWIILVQGWITFGTTQPVYFYAVKPFIRNVGTWFTGKIAEATAINEAKNAAVPATGLPILSDKQIEDFGGH